MLYLVELTRQISVGLMNFVFNVVDVETALPVTFLYPASELTPYLLLVADLVQLKLLPLLVGLYHAPQHSNPHKSFFTATIVAHKGALIVYAVVLEVDSVVVAEVVEHVPGNFGRDERLTVCDAFGSEVRHLLF